MASLVERYTRLMVEIEADSSCSSSSDSSDVEILEPMNDVRPLASWFADDCWFVRSSIPAELSIVPFRPHRLPTFNRLKRSSGRFPSRRRESSPSVSSSSSCSYDIEFTTPMASASTSGRGDEQEEVSRLTRVAYIKSAMTMAKIQELPLEFPWLAECEFQAPTEDEGASTPLKDWFVIYRKQIKAGFRYPVLGGLFNLLHFWLFCPGQVHPNLWADLVGHYMLCVRLGGEPTTDFYKRLGSPKIKSTEDFVHFTGRHKYFYRFSERPNNLKGWKDGFFFIKPKRDQPSFPLRWRTEISLPKAAYNRAEDHPVVLAISELDAFRWSLKEVTYSFIHGIPLVARHPKTREITYYDDLLSPEGPDAEVEREDGGQEEAQCLEKGKGKKKRAGGGATEETPKKKKKKKNSKTVAPSEETQGEASIVGEPSQDTWEEAVATLAEALEKVRISRMRIIHPDVRDAFVWALPLPAEEKHFRECEHPVEDSLLRMVQGALMIASRATFMGSSVLALTAENADMKAKLEAAKKEATVWKESFKTFEAEVKEVNKAREDALVEKEAALVKAREDAAAALEKAKKAEAARSALGEEEAKLKEEGHV